MAESSPTGFRARPLGPQDRDAALDLLASGADEDLFLVDATLNLGETRGSREIAPLIYGAFDGDR